MDKFFHLIENDKNVNKYSYKQEDKSIAATINGIPVYEKDVELQMVIHTARASYANDTNNVDNFKEYEYCMERNEIIKVLAKQYLLIDQAKKAGIFITEDEIKSYLPSESELNKTLNIQQKSEKDKFFQMFGMDYETYTNTVGRNIIEYSLYEREYGIYLSSKNYEDIREYKTVSEYMEEQYKKANIVIY